MYRCFVSWAVNYFWNSMSAPQRLTSMNPLSWILVQRLINQGFTSSIMKVFSSVNFSATIQSVNEAPLSKSSGYTSYFSQSILLMLHLPHSQFQLTRSSTHKKTSWSTLTFWYYMAGELPHVPPLSTSGILMLWKTMNICLWNVDFSRQY